MVEIIVAPPAPKKAQEILQRIRELRKQARRTDAEMAKLNIELGLRFIELKATAAGTWEAKLEKLGFSPRVIRRLMKAASVLAGPDGTVAPRLLARLPGDPIKLETLCGLQRDEIERLVSEHDCRLLDRQEVAALVRERQGKKPGGDQKVANQLEAIRQTWALAIQGLLKKVGKIEDAAERERLIEALYESLDDLREALQGGEEEDTEAAGLETGEEDQDEPSQEGEAEESAGEGSPTRMEVSAPSHASAAKGVGKRR